MSADGSMVAVGHSEHGDLLHPALRVYDARSGEVVGDLWDGEGLGLHAAAWSPVPGDARLAVLHERAGVPRPAVWDVRSGERRDLEVDGPGEAVSVLGWYPEGDALLVAVMTDGARPAAPPGRRRRGPPSPSSTARGSIGAAAVRPDGRVWMRSLSGARARRHRGRHGRHGARARDRTGARRPAVRLVGVHEPRRGARARLPRDPSRRGAVADGDGGARRADLAVPGHVDAARAGLRRRRVRRRDAELSRVDGVRHGLAGRVDREPGPPRDRGRRGGAGRPRGTGASPTLPG